MSLERDIATAVALAVKSATAPLLAEIAVLKSRPVIAPEAVEALKVSEADLRARLLALEGRAAVPGPAGVSGPQGERGEAGAPGQAGPAGPAGSPGERGERGEGGNAGRDGIDGKDGIQGLSGRDGADGINGKDGALGLAGPSGPEGAPGRDGRDGKDGAPGVNGKDGAPGLDGKNGADGLHGKDGLGFDDLALVFDETRGFLLRFERGDQVKEFQVPVPYDAGVWQSGRVYPKGAGVTRDRSFWIAQADATARPGDESAASRVWRLAVCHGRDGKPGKDGRNGTDA